MKFFFGVFLLAAVCGPSLGMIREYSYVEGPTGADWNQALWFCRTWFKDMAIVTNAVEHQKIVEIQKLTALGWIGLFKVGGSQQTWMWADTQEPSLLKWQSGYPLMTIGDPGRDCTYLYQNFWYNDYCKSNYSAYCYRYLILINESKTWNEALEYCATHFTKLASVHHEIYLQHAASELALSQTDSVWTGLRFVNGQWFWLNPMAEKTPLSLPSCPAEPYRCGAFNIQRNAWENQDCAEKRNFLCHWG